MRHMTQTQTGKTLIVLIEDEEIIADLLETKLTKAGYLVKIARDGVQGLKLIRELQPDLVLLDMLLPKLDGFGVLEQLYKEKITPKLPVIIVSNSGQPIEVERATALGIRDYLVKINFDPNEVLAKVNHIMAAEAENAASAPAEKGKTAANAPKAEILIVEDDMLLVDLLARKFKQQGYEIHTATDVRQARTILESNPIGLALLDVVLPGIDGFAFLTELRASDRWKDLPVIIISNLGQTEEVDHGMKSGATDYIVKAQASPGEIVSKVETLLQERSKKPAEKS